MRWLLTALVFLLIGGALAETASWGVARGPGMPDTSLTRRDASGVVLTDGEVPSKATEIVFSDSVQVGRIALSGRTLRFSAAKQGVVLSTTCVTNAFLLRDGDWTFDGLEFSGPGVLPEKAHYYGGAIDCCGGALTVTNCTFSGLATRFNGGAISARLMGGDVLILNSVFTDNLCGPINGTGGAIYASATAGAAVALRLHGCAFRGNSAQSGGAVTTVCTTYDEESPVGLDVRDCTFDGNTVDYNGGAAFVGRDAFVSNTLFSANGAEVQGGAICTCAVDAPTGPKTRLQIRSGTVFCGNCATNDSVWTCGGAIALWGEGVSLDVDDRHVVFAENEAKSAQGAYGGAVYAAAGTAARLSLAQFFGNASETGGGAVFADSADVVVQTSIFSNNTVMAGGYGGAISAEYATLAVSNSTVRGSNGGAVDVYDAAAEIVNSIVVDNGEAADMVFFGSMVDISYSAFGNVILLESVPVNDERNLKGCTEEIYLGDTLELDPALNGGFNTVAVLGLVQDGVTDFKDVGYGTLPMGSSMGAFECPSMQPVLTVDGDRRYDGTTDGLANAEDYVWTVTSTNGQPWILPGCEDITSKLAVTSWNYGAEGAGDYASTNASPEGIVFGIAAKDGLPEDEQSLVNLMISFLSQVATGTIGRRPVVFESESDQKCYDARPLMRHEAADVSATALAGDEPNGIVPGETWSYSFTGSQTEVGVSDNTFTVVWDGTAQERNYEVAYAYGTLTVLPQPSPTFEIVSVEWYHNRGDGLYYPRIVIRFTGGDATRLAGVTLTCDGTGHALPEACVAELRSATTPGQTFAFGVDPDKFPVSYSRTERDGYIIWQSAEEKERAMLFGSYQATRPLTLELAVDAVPEYGDPAPVGASASQPASASAGGTSPAVSRLVQGVAFSRVLTDVPGPKITARGLPNGLKVVLTAVKERIGKKMTTVGHTCALVGTPTKAGTYRARFSRKIGKETVTTEETFTVEPLPAWAYGTFAGWSAGDAVGFSDVGAASLKVTSVGKISGTFAVGGAKWSFSANGYVSAPEDEEGAFAAEVEAKSGKSSRRMRLAVFPDGFRRCSFAGLEDDGAVVGMRRSVWKDNPKFWTLEKAKFDLADFDLAGVRVSVTASGSVKFSGKLPDGTKVSSSSTAFVAEDGSFRAYLIVPATKKSAGRLAEVPLEEGTR